MECPTAKNLLEGFAEAAMKYFDAADKLANLAGSHDQFAVARRHSDELRAKCRVARLALEKHRAEHSCRVATAGNS